MIDGAIPTTGRRSIYPAWESISRRSPARAAALRVGVARGPTQVGPTEQEYCDEALHVAVSSLALIGRADCAQIGSSMSFATTVVQRAVWCPAPLTRRSSPAPPTACSPPS